MEVTAYSILTGSTLLQKLCGNNIFPITPEENPGDPFLVYRQSAINEQARDLTTGAVLWQSLELTIELYNFKAQQLTQIGDEIVMKLETNQDSDWRFYCQDRRQDPADAFFQLSLIFNCVSYT